MRTEGTLTRMRKELRNANDEALTRRTKTVKCGSWARFDGVSIVSEAKNRRKTTKKRAIGVDLHNKSVIFTIDTNPCPERMSVSRQGDTILHFAIDLGNKLGRAGVMGGPGSGSHYHWWRSSKKTLVEDCRSLDANRWMREGILRAGIHHSGGWAWFRDEARTEKTSSIGYEVNTRDIPPWVRLFYTFTESKDAIDYRISLVTTQPQFGGLRWWFICPLIINGRACSRRVGKVYLPPGGRYYGCRHCYNLTYRSVQEHDNRVDALRRNPQALMDFVEDPKSMNLSQLGLALKALSPYLRPGM